MASHKNRNAFRNQPSTAAITGYVIRHKPSSRFPFSHMTFRSKTIAAVAAAATGLFVSGAIAATFSDVPADHWAKPGVDWASQNGIMTGPGNMPGRFDPAGWVNRAQLATVMERMHEMHQEEVLDLRNIVEDLKDRVEDLEEQVDDLREDMDDVQDDVDDVSRSSRSSSRSSTSSGMSSSRSSSLSSSMSSGMSASSASSASSLSSGQSSSF